MYMILIHGYTTSLSGLKVPLRLSLGASEYKCFRLAESLTGSVRAWMNFGTYSCTYI